MLAYDVLHFWDCLPFCKAFSLLIFELRDIVQLLRSYWVMDSFWKVHSGECRLEFRLTITKVFPLISDLSSFSASKVTVCHRVKSVIKLPGRLSWFSIGKVYWRRQPRSFYYQLSGRLRPCHALSHICLHPIDWKSQIVAFHRCNFPRHIETFLRYSLPLGHLVLVHGDPWSARGASR